MTAALQLLLSLFSCLVYSDAWPVSYNTPLFHCSRGKRMKLWSSTAQSLPSSVVHANNDKELNRLQGKLLKQMRQLAQEYEMFQPGDHIMVCVSGGKDSATLLYLLREMQQRLPVSFEMTAVHVNQRQPGYNGTALVQWLEQDLNVNYHVVEEDTYSVVVNKTEPAKSYCTLCSRLRRGILYTTAIQLGCNKIVLGHHGDDALETLLLNMMHSGVLKGMPARYSSHSRKDKPLSVMRPLLTCLEEDVARYAALQDFPILPCNLCSNQANLQRPQVKLLLNALESMTPNAKLNMIRSMTDIRPSHLMDSTLRAACGLDAVTGDVLNTSVTDSDASSAGYEWKEVEEEDEAV